MERYHKTSTSSATDQQLVIAGYDAVSPLGIDLEAEWQRLVRGESGIGMLTRFTPENHFPVRFAGQVDDIDHLAYPFLKPREQANWASPIFKYAMLTVQRALENSGIEISPAIAPRVGITYSSAVGGLDAILNADRRMVAMGKLPHPYANPNSCSNMVGGKISIMTRATGPVVATISACATGLTSVIVGAMLVAQGRAEVVICGAVDFALVEPIVAGFATMNGTYYPKAGEANHPPEKASRPFSKNRRGFIVSEGAGAIIITKREFADAWGLKYNIEIAGWSMTSDAYHVVKPNLGTVQRCIAESIADAGITPGDIATINAHATSTRIGDKVEYDALKAVFNDRIPPVTANKSMIGHAMGASSAIETIFAVKGMLHNVLPPTINHQPDPEIDLDVVSEGARPITQEYVLKNAFGFGGCNSCVVFKRIY